jgi:hypothetical protein
MPLGEDSNRMSETLRTWLTIAILSAMIGLIIAGAYTSH